jgi:hypothetical protein
MAARFAAWQRPEGLFTPELKANGMTAVAAFGPRLSAPVM